MDALKILFWCIVLAIAAAALVFEGLFPAEFRYPILLGLVLVCCGFFAFLIHKKKGPRRDIDQEMKQVDKVFKGND